MLSFLTLIFVCQFLGELMTRLLAFPVPGPVIGMVLLFLYLMVRGDVPAPLEQTANGLLQSLSLLFVPAGTGVMLHLQLIGDELVPISGALIISTIATITVTALMMSWLGKSTKDG